MVNKEFEHQLAERLHVHYREAISNKRKLDSAEDFINDFLSNFEKSIEDVIEVAEDGVVVEYNQGFRDYFARVKIGKAEIQFSRYQNCIEVFNAVDTHQDPLEKIDVIYPAPGEDDICKLGSSGYLNNYALSSFFKQTFQGLIK